MLCYLRIIQNKRYIGVEWGRQSRTEFTDLSSIQFDGSSRFGAGPTAPKPWCCTITNSRSISFCCRQYSLCKCLPAIFRDIGDVGAQSPANIKSEWSNNWAKTILHTQIKTYTNCTAIKRFWKVLVRIVSDCDADTGVHMNVSSPRPRAQNISSHSEHCFVHRLLFAIHFFLPWKT